MLKALPAIMLSAGVAMNSPKVKNLLNYVKVVATQSEVNNITQILSLEWITDEKLPTDPEHFADYVRKIMRVPASSGGVPRDTSKDIWGTPYQLIIDGQTIKVNSGGPDGEYDTDDDVYSKRALGS